jgi:hypothetical protein
VNRAVGEFDVRGDSNGGFDFVLATTAHMSNHCLASAADAVFLNSVTNLSELREDLLSDHFFYCLGLFHPETVNFDLEHEIAFLNRQLWLRCSSNPINSVIAGPADPEFS